MKILVIFTFFNSNITQVSVHRTSTWCFKGGKTFFVHLINTFSTNKRNELGNNDILCLANFNAYAEEKNSFRSYVTASEKRWMSHNLNRTKSAEAHVRNKVIETLLKYKRVRKRWQASFHFFKLQISFHTKCILSLVYKPGI